MCLKKNWKTVEGEHGRKQGRTSEHGSINLHNGTLNWALTQVVDQTTSVGFGPQFVFGGATLQQLQQSTVGMTTPAHAVHLDNRSLHQGSTTRIRVNVHVL